MSHIHQRVIVITGAGGGFGRLLAQQAASRGARVAIADIDGATLDETRSLIEAEGGAVLAVPVDVTDADQVTELVKSAVSEWGTVDVMVNNAGIMPLAFYADHAEAAEAWSRCIDINIKGVLNGIVAVYDIMLAQGRGHVINLSSIYGNYPVKGAAVYGATKAAVNYLSESLRQETLGRIKVTTIRPTGVPFTGLAGGIVNHEALSGITGANTALFNERLGAILANDFPAEWLNAENIEYFALDPALLAEQILYAIDQPWGVSISDMTVRASGDRYAI
jgi:NADP-dependent 3-hydroxy acid dehydrogenase YdfG